MSVKKMKYMYMTVWLNHKNTLELWFDREKKPKQNKKTYIWNEAHCQQRLRISLPDKGFHIYADLVKYLEVNCDFRYNSLAATLTAKQSVCAFCQRVLL